MTEELNQTLEIQMNFIKCLASILKKNGDKVITGECALSLTAEGLHDLFSCFKKYCDQDICSSFEVLHLNQLEPPRLIQDIQFLFEFVQKVKHLKVFHKPQKTIQGDLYLTCFPILENIELREIPSHLLRGLSRLRSRLKKFVIQRSISTVEELLWFCGAERSESQPWSKLILLSLHHNYIEALDDSFDLLPTLKNLDLSHNYLTTTNNYLSSLSKLESLHIGYNNLRIVPFLSSELRNTLTTLSLRYNSLEDMEGLDILINLQYLDYSYNLLSRHSVLKDLTNLRRLKKLYLRGNPIYYGENHRLIVCTFIDPLICRELNLDGKKITNNEYENSNKLPRINFDNTGLLRSLPRIAEPVIFTDSPELIHSRKLKRKRKKPIADDVSSAKFGQGGSSLNEQPHDDQPIQSFQDEILTLRSQMGENWLQAVNEKLLNRNKEIPDIKIDSFESPTERNDQNDNQMPKIHEVKTSTPINVETLPPLQLSTTTNQCNNEQITTEENCIIKPPENSKSTAQTLYEDPSAQSIVSSDPDVDFYINSTDSDNDQNFSDNFFNSDTKKQYIATSLEGPCILEIKDKFLIERDVTGAMRTKLDLSILKAVSNEPIDSNQVIIQFKLINKENQKTYNFDNKDEIESFIYALSAFLNEMDNVNSAYECSKCEDKWNKTEVIQTRPQCDDHSIIENNQSAIVNTIQSSIHDNGSIPSADSEIEILSTSKTCEPTFDFLDNLLNLHLSLNLLDEEDTVRLLYECQYQKHKGKKKHQCLLVFSQKYLFVLHLLPNSRNVKSVPWKKVAIKVELNTVTFLERGPFFQYLRIEFDAKSDIVPATFFFPDEYTGEAFIEKLNFNLSELRKEDNSILKVNSCRSDTLETIQRLFQLENSSRLPEIIYYSLCIWELSETIKYNASIILSEDNIAIVDENFEYWPLPHDEQFQAKEVSRLPEQFKILYKKQITNIESLCLRRNNVLQINFFQEDEENEPWHVKMQSDRGVKSLIAAIKEPWSQAFGQVDLKVNSQTKV